MRFYDRALRSLSGGEQTLRRVYDITFGFGKEVYFEEYDGASVKKTLYGEAEGKIIRAACVIWERLGRYGAGSVVGLDLANSPDWVILFWALLRAGMRPLLVHRTAPAASAAGALADAGACAVISDRSIPGVHCEDSAALLAGDAPPLSSAHAFADEILLMTSGVSGEPRVFAFGGRAVCAQIRNSGYVLRRNGSIKRFYRGSLKLLSLLPFCHIYGLVTVLLWFGFFGRTVVFPRDLAASSVRAACSVCGVTHLFAVPVLWDTAAQGILREAERSGESRRLERGLALSIRLQSIAPRFGERAAAALFGRVRRQVFGEGIKFCINGGGAVGYDTLRVINGIGYPLYNGYGMTEIGIGSVELRRSARARLKGSVGQPFPSIEYTLRRDADGDDILWVRGESCFTARYSHGVRTPNDPEEWFGTGDAFELRPDRRYYIKGRSDEMFSGADGERICLCDIERVLRPVASCRMCVLGLDGAVTLVAEAPGSGYRRAMLVSEVLRANGTLPPAERIRRVLVTASPLPETHNGKLRRGALASLIMSGGLETTELALTASDDISAALGEDAAALAGEIAKIAAGICGRAGSDIGANTNFLYGLSMGSIQYYELLTRVSERFGVTFSLSERLYSTAAELAEAVIRGGE